MVGCVDHCLRPQMCHNGCLMHARESGFQEYSHEFNMFMNHCHDGCMNPDHHQHDQHHGNDSMNGTHGGNGTHGHPSHEDMRDFCVGECERAAADANIGPNDWENAVRNCVDGCMPADMNNTHGTHVNMTLVVASEGGNNQGPEDNGP